MEQLSYLNDLVTLKLFSCYVLLVCMWLGRVGNTRSAIRYLEYLKTLYNHNCARYSHIDLVYYSKTLVILRYLH